MVHLLEGELKCSYKALIDKILNRYFHSILKNKFQFCQTFYFFSKENFM